MDALCYDIMIREGSCLDDDAEYMSILFFTAKTWDEAQILQSFGLAEGYEVTIAPQIETR